MNYLTARIDKLEKEYNLLEKDNNRLAARNQNYLEMLLLKCGTHGREKNINIMILDYGGT